MLRVLPQTGLPGCSIITSVALTRAGLGRLLFVGLQTLPLADIPAHLLTWRVALATELRYNHSGMLWAPLPDVADVIPHTFPDLRIINLYLHPLTSENLRPLPILKHQYPNLPALAAFSAMNFDFHYPMERILRTFCDHIFPVMALRDLIQQCLVRDGFQDKPLSPYPLVTRTQIVRERASPSTSYFAELRIAIPIGWNLYAAVCSGVFSEEHDPDDRVGATKWFDEEARKLHTWVPLAIMKYAYPSGVAAYQESVEMLDSNGNCMSYALCFTVCSSYY